MKKALTKGPSKPPMTPKAKPVPLPAKKQAPKKAQIKRNRKKKAKVVQIRRQPERAPTVNFTMRLRPSLLDELRLSAEGSQTSISSEAERRLSQAQVGDVGKLIGTIISSTEQQQNKLWSEDIVTRRRCRFVIDLALTAVFGPSSFPAVLRDLAGKNKWLPNEQSQIDLKILEEFFSNDGAASIDQIVDLIPAFRKRMTCDKST